MAGGRRGLKVKIMHINSLQAYATIGLKEAQLKIARILLQETNSGRSIGGHGLYRKYGILPSSSSPRLGELVKMANEGKAFTIDGVEYAIECTGRRQTGERRFEDVFQLQLFATHYAKLQERQRQDGLQIQMFQ